MSVWCPQCGAEYVSGWRECSECGVPLTSERPQKPPDEEVYEYEPDDTGPSLVRMREVEEPFVTIWEGPTPEGMTMVRRLEDAAIPVDTGEAAEAGRLRLEVPQSYINEAYGVLDAAGAAPLTSMAADYNGSDPDALPGWPSAARIAFVVVAVALIVALVLTLRP